MYPLDQNNKIVLRNNYACCKEIFENYVTSHEIFLLDSLFFMDSQMNYYGQHFETHNAQ